MTEDFVAGRRCDTTTPAIGAAVTELVEECSPDLGGRVLVLPDAHYPFHPSTGAVTNPDTVEMLVETLTSRGADVTLCLPETPWVDGTDCTTYLGYDAIVDRTGVETLALGDAPTVERRVHIDDRTVDVEVPEALEADPLVVVPTLRTDPDRSLVATLVTTAMGAYGVSEADLTPDEVVAATAVCDPAFTLLDGTYTYTGAPHRSRFLVAGTDAPAVDRAAATLVGKTPADIPYLAPFGLGREPVDGFDLEELAASLPNEEPAPDMSDSGGPAAMGYRLYARVTGDLVPPQFMGEEDG
ncbi:DUF362 domain-containing protein [Halomarina litorea]|uniref:DUF362 domain-containing protein n=1 Tax=Halomarina litorea TaxID=2961595 RepID=UPI0020C2E21A|nr:DUF362 domain-containing protein [Halomarina sp. BCD28]